MTATANQAAIRQYVQALNREHETGAATEHSYRPALKALMEGLGGSGVLALNEASRVAAGVPDFVVQRSGLPIGFVECKNVGTSLEVSEKSEQLRRYRAGLDNLILTDYLDFRWYVNGTLQMQASICNGLPPPRRLSDARLAEVLDLLDTFLVHTNQSVVTPNQLAERLAHKARLLRDSMMMLPDFPTQASEPSEAEPSEPTVVSRLQQHFDAYRNVLLPDLTPEQFADLQAQTAVYGLFAARILTPSDDSFDRKAAVFTDTTPFPEAGVQLGRWDRS